MAPSNNFRSDPTANKTIPSFGNRQRFTDRAAAVDKTVGATRHVVSRLVAGRIAEQDHGHHAGRQAPEHDSMLYGIFYCIHDRILS